MGAVTFKTDFSENIDEYAIYKNIDAQKYRNLFSLLYQKATWEAIDEVTLACGLDQNFRRLAEKERDLESLREHPRFLALLPGTPPSPPTT